MHKIIVYPKDKNPYQQLLYEEISNFCQVKFIGYPMGSRLLGLILLIPTIILNRVQGYRIFHLHWLNTFKSTFSNRLFHNFLTRFLFTVYFLIVVLLIRSLGYKLVWTIHNVIPHEKQFSNDIFVVRFLSTFTNAKIAHSKTTLEIMSKLKISTRNVFIIPIGTYASIYKNNIDKREAREYLNIDNKNMVFLFFGLVREYKGVDDLLENFSKLKSEYTHISLLIAGQCTDQSLKDLIKEYQDKFNDSIKVSHKFIPNNELQYYLNAADIVVLPFKRVTTSSTAIVSMDFHKAIIFPRLGIFKDLPPKIGFSYLQNDKEGLYKAMLEAFKSKKKLENLGNNGGKYIKSLSWNKIAQQTIEVYDRLN